MDAVENNKIECLSKILRIKNGFNEILTWNSATDAGYRDIKINCVFVNKENSGTQIVEIQFLADFLVTAKKMGHKYYAIKRQETYIDSIDHLIYDNNNDYENFKTKINTIISDNDLDKMSKCLFFQPNLVLSIIKYKKPLLSHIGSDKQYRMYKLFLDCLFHFGEVLLNEKEPDRPCTIYDKDNNTMGEKSDNYNTGYDAKDYPPDDRYKKIDANNKLFLQKYFNFTHGGAPVMTGYHFVKCLYSAM